MSRSDQVPTNSGFTGRSTGDEVLAGIDLTGRTAIVTGGYSGLGLETTRALARAGARVVVAVRTPEKAADSLADIEGQVETAPLDLSELPSVRAFADQMVQRLDRLDLLINNAGIMACPLARVGPGWESQFGVNHIGHFALTQGLLPLLRHADRARVVCLSSGAHKRSDIRWDDIGYDRSPYDKWQAYGQAKTANALFANALSRRLRDDGGRAFAVHPGGIFTPLQRHLPTEEMIALGWLGEDGQPSEMARRGFKTPEQGCATTLWAATSALLDDTPGVYCEDCDIAEPTDPTSPMARYRGVDDHATSDESAERLWAISEDLLAQA
jgi:NAD(P)-dependent dehydrogenase (short-subunit alcohol dehydrogenase family)